MSKKDIPKADTIFLSPPWGGMDYKNCADYSLKQWITPNIYDIIRTSRSLAKNLILYLPRNSNLVELFEIISEIFKPEEGEEEEDTLFGEIRILNSSNSTKALLVCFGEDYNQVNLY